MAHCYDSLDIDKYAATAVFVVLHGVWPYRYLIARVRMSTFQDTAESESNYWIPADTEEGIQKQLREKMFPNIVDKLVSLESKLGEGEFGEVYKGLWKVPGKGTPMEVAIKVPKGSSDENRIKVLQETAILGQFSHRRIARLCGMVTLSNPVRTTCIYYHQQSCCLLCC